MSRKGAALFSLSSRHTFFVQPPKTRGTAWLPSGSLNNHSSPYSTTSQSPAHQNVDRTFPCLSVTSTTLTCPSFHLPMPDHGSYLDKVINMRTQQKKKKITGGVTKDVTKLTYKLGLYHTKKKEKQVPGRGEKLLNRTLP